MFKVTTEPKFTHPVTVCVPTDGGHVEQTFKATFRVLDADQLSPDSSVEGQIEDLRRVLVTMHDLVGEDDQAVSYSDALRDQLIRLPYVRIALINAYVRGVTKAKQGN
jgi:hypothetical protein